MEIPLDISKIMCALTDKGYEAFVVGGCVRDSLLHKKPKDWDITTNATPAQMCNALSDYRLIPTGEKYGTITVLVGGMPYEITTYRADGNYSDGRRPDKVTFSQNIEEDLQRRDFTINAMAYSHHTGLIDLFGGMTDIKNKVIRCVGNPKDRFKEDALRIMRAIRFACRLNFTVSEDTVTVILEQVDNLKHVSQERITGELIEILKAKNEKNRHLTEYIIKSTIPEICKRATHTPNMFNYTMDGIFIDKTGDIEILLAILFCDNCAEKSAKMAQIVLTRMKFDNKTINNVCYLIRNHDLKMQPNKRYAKGILNKFGYEKSLKLLEFQILHKSAHKHSIEKKEDFEQFSADAENLRNLWQQIIEDKEVFQLKDLAINGDDLIKFGIPQGKNLGKILLECLEYVMDNPENNNKNDLYKEVVCTTLKKFRNT
ncbi:MAG: CCA tRNA nucleotidyltransferase [Defluviitaleaceae bacterium]|nr:CCA tRNA nucleotidyltransferase [Defluviitaleaceae bacterium]